MTFKLNFLTKKLFNYMGIQSPYIPDKVVDKYFNISLFFSFFLECIPMLFLQVNFGKEMEFHIEEEIIANEEKFSRTVQKVELTLQDALS